MSYELRHYLLNEDKNKAVIVKFMKDFFIKGHTRSFKFIEKQWKDDTQNIKDKGLEEKFVVLTNKTFGTKYKSINDMAFGPPYGMSKKMLKIIWKTSLTNWELTDIFISHIFQMVTGDITVWVDLLGEEISIYNTINIILILHLLTGRIYRTWKKEVQKNHFKSQDLKKQALSTI